MSKENCKYKRYNMCDRYAPNGGDTFDAYFECEDDCDYIAIQQQKAKNEQLKQQLEVAEKALKEIVNLSEKYISPYEEELSNIAKQALEQMQKAGE